MLLLLILPRATASRRFKWLLRRLNLQHDYIYIYRQLGIHEPDVGIIFVDLYKFKCFVFLIASNFTLFLEAVIRVFFLL